MNPSEDQIESVLRQAPRPEPPASLRPQIVQGIPQPRTDRQPAVPAHLPWWQRWWPTLAAGSLAAVCLVVLAVQQVEIRQLTQEIEALRQQQNDTRPDVPGSITPTRGNTTPPAVVVPQADAAAELARLRTTARELAAELTGLQALKAQNEQLRSQVLAQAGVDPAAAEALAAARAKAQRIACVNNLKQLGLAVRVWATDHNDIFPPDVLTMSNEIGSTKVLVCPADEGRQPAPDWASFTPANTSYEYLAPLGSDLEPQRVMFLCSQHNNITLGDGSVQQLSPEHRANFVNRDGKLFYERTLQPPPPGLPTTAMPEEMMRRYGLLPPPAPENPNATQPAPMSEELMRRYGLLPPNTAPAPTEPAEEPSEEEPAP
ncbi:MAG: DUF1559 domain-containing protein [Verrucomicrobiales bacterium]|nr:DUF1559 domain-containing protein [Verrucomicrobiales bacterium]